VLPLSVLLAEKLIALLHKDFSYYKDFLGEDKDCGIFGSCEKLPRIKIDGTRNTPVCTERIKLI